MKHFLTATILSLFTFAAACAHSADGKTVFVTCQACHGARGEGNHQLGAPNIAGLNAAYIERQLRNFASGARGAAEGDSYGAQMRAAVKTVANDADRSAVATYIAAMPAVLATDKTLIDKSDITNGRNYFNAVCSACHGAGGLGNPNMGVPPLAGIDPAYLARQFAAFRAGTRGSNRDDKLGAQMRAIVSMLPDAKTERDVMAYIASLKP